MTRIDESRLDLITGYLSGNLSEDDEIRLFDWMDESEENKHAFFEYKTLYDHCRMEHLFFDPDVSWQRLWYKIEVQARRKRSLFYARVSAYAALFLLIVVSAVTAIQFWSWNESQVYYSHFVTGKSGDTGLLELPDGSLVHVGPKTSIRYGSDFNREKREVYLEGEAFFDVAKNPEKPFIVKAKEQKIEVLGTRFNVLAYPTDSLFMTTLQEGKVKLSLDNQEGDIFLQPDQMLVFNRNRNEVNVESVDASAASSWVQGNYHFQKETLPVILQRIGHIYDVHFLIESDEIRKKTFTGTISRKQSLTEILDLIRMSVPTIDYYIHDNLIEIKKRN